MLLCLFVAITPLAIAAFTEHVIFAVSISIIVNGGFAAIKGWDPATGLGTPNFEKLAALV